MNSRDRISTSYPPLRPGSTILFLLLLAAASSVRVEAQSIWTTRTILSSRDSLHAPSVAVAPDGEIYLAYSSSDIVHHWLTQPDRGSLSYAIRRDSPAGRPVSNGINLLTVDSGGDLHFLSVFGESTPCLQYGSTAPGGTPTLLDPLRPIGEGICGESVDGVSGGLDRSGRLHVVYRQDGSIVYRVRETDGTWSSGNVLPGTDPLSHSPSLLVTPSGELHVTFTGGAGTGAMLYYSNGADPPTAIAERGSITAGTAPIALDPDGRIQVAFGELVDGKGEIRLVTREPNGVWSLPETIIRGNDSEFGDISLVADRYGALHLVTSLVEAGDREIVYAENADGMWSQPVPITADDLENVVTNRGNGFLVVRDSLLLLASSALPGRTGLYSISLARTVLDFDPEISIVPDVLDLGTVTAPLIDTTIIISNLGRRLYGELRPDATDTIRTDHLVIPPLFTGVPKPVRGGDSLSIPLSLTFTQAGPFEYTLQITSNGGIDSVLIRGTYSGGAVPERVVRLDTATVDIGERQVLVCRVDPPLTAADEITAQMFTVVFDPDALVSHAVNGSTDRLEALWFYDEMGGITVEIADPQGGYLIGSELFSVEFEALLTARPANEVKVHPVPGSSLEGAEKRFGLVLVNGCEIGSLPPFAKGGFVGSPSPNPAGGTVTFEWIAPLGVDASIRIIDASGSLIREHPLPVGTGEVQQADIDLDRIPSGLYFMELRTGSARVLSHFIRR